MKTRSRSRRSFLEAIGVGAGSALLPLLHADRARAATPFPKRLLIVVTSNGVLQNLYWPEGGERDFHFPTGTAEIPHITAPLEAIKRDILCVKGITMKSAIDDKDVFGGHDNFTHMLVGTRQEVKGKGEGHDFRGTKAAGGISVDQHIATRLNAPTRFRSLVAGVMVRSRSLNQARVSWAGRGTPVTPQDNPAQLYATLFGGADDADGNEPAWRALKEKRSVLDLVSGELARFQRELGTDDRTRVESHLTAIREIERRFDPRSASAQTCAAAAPDGTLDLTKMANYPQVGKLQMDLLVEAMACDLTRVATLQWSNANGGGVVFSWLGEEFTQESTKDKAGRGEFGPIHNHHEITHHGARLASLKSRAEHWFHQQLVYLVEKLRSKREGAGTMLDNTVVLWANNMHDGANHTHGPHLPWILAGRGGGSVQTGRYLDLSAAPVPHNRVLLSLCETMGVAQPTFGDPQYCAGGALAQLRG